MSFLGILPPELEAISALTPIWLFPGERFYFALGFVASLHLAHFRPALDRAKWYLVIGLVACLVLTIPEYELVEELAGREWLGPTFSGISRDLYAVAFILCFLAFERIRLPGSGNLSKLGSKSLGVFLVNTPAIYVIGGLLYHKAPWALGQQLIYQSILSVAGLSIPLLLMEAVRRSKFKWAYRYVFG